ncbi:MAG TPA: bifunctional 4-hydroxy-2-oxoglutarate aldolase/2-dehydro-3-deoxy-phosphogluconate aldolase [Gaiellaceae bacterium]
MADREAERSEVLERLSGIGVVPVVEIEDAAAAVELADALASGGVGAAEITFRTAAAADAIRAIAEARPDFLVGAGTVLTAEAIELAHDAGASFAVSPGFGERVAEAASRHGIPYIPGGSTATEIQHCLGAGYPLVKFFPAEALGGVAMLTALAAPFQSYGVRFMPTGGIRVANAAAYLAKPWVACVGGTWLATRTALAERDFAAVRELAAEAAALVASARGPASAS